jgi:hypothetical protein
MGMVAEVAAARVAVVVVVVVVVVVARDRRPRSLLSLRPSTRDWSWR